MGRDGVEVTSSGKLFQILAPAIGNARLPTVDRRKDGTSSWLDDEDRSLRQLGMSATLRRQVRQHRTMQGAKCQHGYLEDDPLWNTKPVKAKRCIGNVFGSPHVKDEPGCSILPSYAIPVPVGKSPYGESEKPGITDGFSCLPTDYHEARAV